MRSVEVRSHKKDAAVSPVVGVMLMLVVTIVIAAVVAMFATGVFSETKTASTAVIELEKDGIYKVSGQDACYIKDMTFTHKGGDKLTVSDLTLKITYNGMTASNAFSDVVSDGKTTWSVGEKIVLTSDDTNGLGKQVMTSSPSYYTWSITDASKMVIASGQEYFDVSAAEKPTVAVTVNGPAGLAQPYVSNYAPVPGETVTITAPVNIVSATVAENTPVVFLSSSSNDATTVTIDGNRCWFTMPDCDNGVTVTVNYSGATFTITYNMNGGEWAAEYTAPTSYTNGTGATLPIADNITKTGNTFSGWYTDSEFTSDPVTTISTTDTGNKTFYAKWTNIPYTITYDMDGGNWVAEYTAPISYTYGTGATLPIAANITKTGNTFSGWYTDSEFTSNPVTTISTTDTGNKTFYAKWTQLLYSMTYKMANGTTEYYGSGDDVVNENLSGSVSLLGSVPSGWTRPLGDKLVGWKIGDVNYDLGQTVTMNSDKVVYPRWADDETTIRFVANAGEHGNLDTTGSGLTKCVKLEVPTGVIITMVDEGENGSIRITGETIDEIEVGIAPDATYHRGAIIPYPTGSSYNSDYITTVNFTQTLSSTVTFTVSDEEKDKLNTVPESDTILTIVDGGDEFTGGSVPDLDYKEQYQFDGWYDAVTGGVKVVNEYGNLEEGTEYCSDDPDEGGWIATGHSNVTLYAHSLSD